MNPFPFLDQISVQRSYDSVKFFQTIFSSQSPNLPQNGFVDNNVAPGVKVFYRIFYVKEEGNYAYSVSLSIKPSDKKIAAVTGNLAITKDKKRVNTDIIDLPENTTALSLIKFINIYNGNKDSLLYVLEYADYERFRDSIFKKTKDTLIAINHSEILWKKYAPEYIWQPSLYIFTTPDNDVKLQLPHFREHRYKVKFFTPTHEEIFEIKHVKEDILILDKTNFVHAGWFYFELFEDDILKEKNKLYVESDF